MPGADWSLITTIAPSALVACTYELEEAFTASNTFNCPITALFQYLSSIRSTWGLDGDLILDASIYSHSDSNHGFKHLTFRLDTPSDMLAGGGTK